MTVFNSLLTVKFVSQLTMQQGNATMMELCLHCAPIDTAVWWLSTDLWR